MRLLDTIPIRGKEGKRIELHQGDLTTLRPDEAVDLLVVSAFPNDYLPTSTSLIGALYKKGLSVAALAQLKEKDLRQDFSCWLSHEINLPNSGLRFRKILCFEPMVRGEPPELVGDIFRAMMPILGEKSEISSVANAYCCGRRPGLLDFDYACSAIVDGKGHALRLHQDRRLLGRARKRSD
jgi:hypothetical protein